MNALIITLGNSEIQFDELNIPEFEFKSKDEKTTVLSNGILELPVRKNFRPNKEVWWVPDSSREGGKYILNHYEAFENILRFPIVENLIDFVKGKDIKDIFWVVTDQSDIIHKRGDTIFYAEIIEKYFKKNLILAEKINFSTIKVSENVKDIDYQYQFFRNFFSKTIFCETNPDDKIYLFAQGGIDQINHALTLQLLQKYKSQVRIYQKAEDEALKEVLFPHMFIKDLNRQKILKHLEDYDFGKAEELILDDLEAKKLAHYSNLRLGLNHGLIDQSDLDEKYKFVWESNSEIGKKLIKLTDLVYAFKIDFLQKKYNDGLTKLFTIYENIFKLKIDELTNTDTSNFYNFRIKEKDDVNENWESYLRYYFGDSIKEKLLKKKKNLILNNPNTMTYFYLIRFISNNESQFEIGYSEEEILKLDKVLDNLRAMRNDINHTLGSATLNEINSRILIAKSNYDEFIFLLHKFTKSNDYGIHEFVRGELLSKYKL